MVEFGTSTEMKKLSHEAQEFFENILPEEEPIFVSDEATVWDVATISGDELLRRCTEYYGEDLAASDLDMPLWQLLKKLNEGHRKHI